MKPGPEDGSLDEITTSGLNSELNIIIIQRPEEIYVQDGATYTFATLDRTREGIEWPGDKILEKLIPGLPKVKTPEVSKSEATTKTNYLPRNHVKRKFHQRPTQRNNHCSTAHQPRPPPKRFRSDRDQLENPSSFNDIDPWVCKPWDTYSRMNTTPSVSATSMISTTTFNNFYAPTSASSLPFPPSTGSNVFNVPNSSTYNKNTRPTVSPNIPFESIQLGHQNRPPPKNRIPFGPPIFPKPNRFSQHPDRGFCGHDSNVDFNGPSHRTGLLGEKPTVRYRGKHGLLGDAPFPNMSFNRNTAMFPNGVSAQTNSQGIAATVLSRDKEGIGDKNSSISGSFDTDYCRIPESNFNQYKDGNEVSGQELYNSYECPNNSDESRNYSYRDASKTNYSRFQNSGSSVNHYEEHHKNSYNHLDHNKNISLKNSRDSQKTNYRRFKKPSAGTSYSKSSYKEVGDDNLYESGYNSQIASTSKTSNFMNNQSINSMQDSLIHISDAAVVYDSYDFQNAGYSAAATNSSASQSNFKRNIHSKNTLEMKERWTANKNRNNYYRKSRGKYIRGYQRSRSWSTSQK